MSEKPSSDTRALLRVLWRHISPEKQRKLSYLAVALMLSGLAETVSIGTVLPFLFALTLSEEHFQHPLFKPFLQLSNTFLPNQLLLTLTLVFGISVLISGGMRLFGVWATSRLAFSVGADLGLSLYRRVLFQPYEVHVGRNSSAVLNLVSGKVDNVITHIVLPILSLFGHGVMLILILALMMLVNSAVTLLVFSGFGLSYWLISGLTRSKLLHNSQTLVKESTGLVKSVQEGLGGIRDILIDGSQPVYAEQFQRINRALRRVQSNNIFIGAFPRYLMEALGMCFIAVLAYVLIRQQNSAIYAIPLLGLFGLAAQRVLPLLQQCYGAWANIQIGRKSLRDIVEILEKPLPGSDALPSSSIVFQTEIALSQLSFRYDSATPWILKNIDLSISKGERIGLSGKTGSGKSTLLDIIMGLLQPIEGNMMIDGQIIDSANRRNWQARIAHVPQAIFLADTDIESNIAFGQSKPHIDYQRVRKAARQAQIADLIESWPQGYQTRIGERGIKLSGGQRQRLGLARALYKQADVIILDEATNALDLATEQAVMHTIHALAGDVTLIIVAHRHSAFTKCDRVYELIDGKIRLIP